MSTPIDYNEIVTKLMEMGISKYAIAKHCGCSWSTVHAWSRRWWCPSVEYVVKLQRLYIRETGDRQLGLFSHAE